MISRKISNRIFEIITITMTHNVLFDMKNDFFISKFHNCWLKASTYKHWNKTYTMQVLQCSNWTKACHVYILCNGFVEWLRCWYRETLFWLVCTLNGENALNKDMFIWGVRNAFTYFNSNQLFCLVQRPFTNPVFVDHSKTSCYIR